jgi:hypothetical protein
MGLFIFLHVKKTNQKKTPASRFTLRVAAAAGARRNSLALKQADALFPSAASMRGAGQRGAESETANRESEPPSRGRPDASRSAGGDSLYASGAMSAAILNLRKYTRFRQARPSSD